MSKRAVLLSGWVLVMMILAACGAQAAAPASRAATPEAMLGTPAAMMEKTPDAMMATSDAMMATSDAMMHVTPEAMLGTPEAMMTTPDAMMTTPVWFSTALTNAATGGTFTIQDLKGKVVLVEAMAMWCPTCLSQAKEVKALHDQLGMRDDLVSVSIDIDLNENIADLKGYATKNGFDWMYTIASPDVAREIGNLYGQQFLNPPSAPMLIIDRHGVVHPLPFGLKSAADLQKALGPFLNETM